MTPVAILLLLGSPDWDYEDLENDKKLAIQFLRLLRAQGTVSKEEGRALLPKMMFDDSSVVGGTNSSMLNTSMKSEGGLSVLNTSRGEEVVVRI